LALKYGLWKQTFCRLPMLKEASPLFGLDLLGRVMTISAKKLFKDRRRLARHEASSYPIYYLNS